MATYTAKDRTAQKATFEKLRADYIAANKAAKLSAVHQRVRDCIQATDLARVWRLAHGGASSARGYYNVQGKTQAGTPARGGSPYAAFYTPPGNVNGPFTPNQATIDASPDMALGAKIDQYLRGWCYVAQKADHAIGIDEPWKLRSYTYTDPAGGTVTVKQTAAWYALKMAAVNATNHGIAGQQTAAQAFADAVLAQAPAWYQPALVYINTITAFKPRVAVASAARNLSGDVKNATAGLDKLKAAIGKAAAADQPTSAPGGGTTEGQRQQTPPDEGKSNLLLVLGIAAAAGAVILLTGEEAQ